MKIKNIISNSFKIIFVFAGIIVGNAQQMKEVPDVPEEIRELPESFKEDYTGDAYNYVESISFFSRMKAWILEHIMSWLNVSNAAADNIIGVLKIIFYLIIIGVILYIIKLVLAKEGRWIFKKKQ